MKYMFFFLTEPDSVFITRTFEPCNYSGWLRHLIYKRITKHMLFQNLRMEIVPKTPIENTQFKHVVHNNLVRCAFLMLTTSKNSVEMKNWKSEHEANQNLTVSGLSMRKTRFYCSKYVI